MSSSIGWVIVNKKTGKPERLWSGAGGNRVYKSEGVAKAALTNSYLKASESVIVEAFIEDRPDIGP